MTSDNWDPARAYAMADRLYKHVCDLTTHQAMVVIAAIWDVVYEKVKARDKGAV